MYCLIQQLDLRFSDQIIQVLRALCLIPSHLYKDDEEAIVADDLYKFYCDDELIPLCDLLKMSIAALWEKTALMLLYVHKDIELNIDAIIDSHGRKYPRRMLLIDPICEV